VDATKLLDKARVAAERGNYDYAIDLYIQLLELQPNHVDARRKLREVEVRKFQERGVTGSSASAWLTGISSLLVGWICYVIRKYEKTMSACEVFLKKDPFNTHVLRLLGKAAQKAGHLDTAILANEDARARCMNPTKGLTRGWYIRLLFNLDDLYREFQKFPTAAERLEEVLRIQPGNRIAERRIRDVAAHRSMVEGRWDQVGQKDGYRKVLKDQAGSQKLEDAHRDIRTREDMEAAIERTKNDLAGDPQNTRYLTQIGDLYRMLNDWNQSRIYYEKAQSIDPTNFQVQEKMGDLRLAEMDDEIERLARDEANQERVTQLRKERFKFAFEEFHKRVQARPQDLPTRYAYGTLLLQAKHYKDASVQFQYASRDPKTRRPALYRLGICFQKQGLVDLAIEQYEKAAAGASVVDQEVKDVLYALAEAHESQERLTDALTAYKRIFEVDINFRNVSAKIEELYKKGAREAS
jgi:tetratricopeptide (TPR) repeat protein